MNAPQIQAMSLSAPMSPAVALSIFLLGTAAMLLLTLTWAVANRRPAKTPTLSARRRTAVYRHTPTQLQDERGITARR